METNARFETERGAGGARTDAIARDVRSSLLRSPRAIPSKYFYDATGSLLFDSICELPEYYVTRAERALLAVFADAIVDRTGAGALIEIGSGMARKTGLIARALCARFPAPLYIPFDISAEAITASARSLTEAHPTLRVRGIVGDFACDCARLKAGAFESNGPRLFAFLGSTIGNMDEEAAPAFLRSLRNVMTDADAFLLGIDLAKAPHVLRAAYNDRQGITARFNKNVLRVLARELGGEIDEDAFEHLAVFDEAKQRIEMYLVSTRPQTLVLRAAGLRETLFAGERILTEISRKFTRPIVEQTLAQGGMKMVEWITDEGGAYALCLARKAS